MSLKRYFKAYQHFRLAPKSGRPSDVKSGGQVSGRSLRIPAGMHISTAIEEACPLCGEAKGLAESGQSDLIALGIADELERQVMAIPFPLLEDHAE